MVNVYGDYSETGYNNPYAGNPAPAQTGAQADANNRVRLENRAKIGDREASKALQDLDNREAAAANASAATTRTRDLSRESANYQSGQAASTMRRIAVEQSPLQRAVVSASRGAAYEMAEEAARKGERIDPYVLEKARQQGWTGASQTISKEEARQTVPTRDYSSGMGAPVLMTPGGGADFYVPYGDRAKTQIKDAKAVYSPGGELGLFQLRPARPGFTPRYGFLTSGGGLNALQSGMFTVGRAGTPVVYTQESAGTKLVPGTDISLANAVLTNPQLFSRSGAELYGGDVMRLDNRTVTPETKLSTYPKGSGNLAGLVDPFAVNRPKGEIVGNIPWSINANAPTFQQTDRNGNLTPTPANKLADIAFGATPIASSAKPATQMSATPQPARQPNIFGGLLDWISYNISPPEGRGKSKADVLREAKASNTAYGTSEKGMLFAGDRLVRVWNGDKTSVGGVSPMDAVINRFLNPGQTLEYDHTHPLQYPEMNLTSLGQANQPSKVDRDSAAVGMRLGVTRTGIVTAADMTGNRNSTLVNYYGTGTTGFFNGSDILGMSAAMPPATPSAQPAKPSGLPIGIRLSPLGKSMPEGSMPKEGTTVYTIPPRKETVNTADVPLIGSILGIGDMALSIPLPGGSNVGQATGVKTFQFEMPAGRPSADVPVLGMQKGIGWGDILNKPTIVTETVGKAREEKVNTYQSGQAAWTRGFVDNAGKKSDSWSYPIGEPTYSEPFAIGSPIVTRTVNPKTGEVTITTEQQMGRTKMQPMETVTLPSTQMIVPITTKTEVGKSAWDVKNEQLSNDLIFSPIGGRFGLTGEQAKVRAGQIAAGSRIATSANPTAQNMIGNFVINAGVGAAENPLNIAKVAGEAAVLGGVFRVVGLGGEALAGSSLLANSPRVVKAGSIVWKYGVPGVLATAYAANVESRVTQGNTNFGAGQISGETGKIFSTEILPMGVGFTAGYKAPDAAVRAGERGVKAAQMTKLDYLSMKQEAQGQNLANIPTMGRPGLGEIKYNVGDYAKFKAQKGVAEAQGRAAIFGEGVANKIVEAKVMTKPKVQVAATNAIANVMGKYYEKMGYGKYSPPEAPAPKTTGKSGGATGTADTGFGSPPPSRMGTKTVGGVPSRGLAREPSLKSLGIKETSTTVEPTSGGVKSDFAKNRATDFRQQPRGSMKPMNTMQSAISMPQEFAVSAEMPSLAKASEGAAPAIRTGAAAPAGMRLMSEGAGTGEGTGLEVGFTPSVGMIQFPITEEYILPPMTGTPVSLEPPAYTLPVGAVDLSEWQAKNPAPSPFITPSTTPTTSIASTAPDLSRVGMTQTIPAGTTLFFLGSLGNGKDLFTTDPTQAAASGRVVKYTPMRFQQGYMSGTTVVLPSGNRINRYGTPSTIGENPMFAGLVSELNAKASSEMGLMGEAGIEGMGSFGFGEMGFGGIGFGEMMDVPTVPVLRTGLLPPELQKKKKAGINVQFTSEDVEPMFGIKPSFILKSAQAQKSKSGQSIMQRAGQSQVQRQAKMQQFDQTLRQVSLPALVSGLKSRQEQSQKQSQKQITGLAAISITGQKSAQIQGQRQVQKQQQVQRQRTVSEQVSVEKLFGKTTTVPPVFPNGVGAFGGEGANPRGLKAFREHSPTITTGEMTKGLFTGSYTGKAPRRQVRGNLNFAALTGVGVGSRPKKGRGKR